MPLAFFQAHRLIDFAIFFYVTRGHRKTHVSCTDGREEDLETRAHTSAFGYFHGNRFRRELYIHYTTMTLMTAKVQFCFYQIDNGGTAIVP